MLKITRLNLLFLICWLSLGLGTNKLRAAETTTTIDVVSEQKKIQAMLDSFLNSIGKSPKDYTIEVVESKDLNAFATLGKRIVVYTELIKMLDSDSGLALVIAHELGHLERKHLIKSMIRNNLSTVVRHYVFKDNKILGSLEQLEGLHYSRDTEKDADMFGINLVNKFYCNVLGKLEFFEKMSKLEKSGKFSEYFSTHPLSSSRIDYLKAEILAKNCVL